MMDKITSVKKFILRELIKRRKIGGSHTTLDNVVQHLSDEFLKEKRTRKIIESALKELVNDKMVIVLKKRTGKGSDLHISINPRKLKEIAELLSLPQPRI